MNPHWDQNGLLADDDSVCFKGVPVNYTEGRLSFFSCNRLQELLVLTNIDVF
jgi:hypothetical protein